MTRMNFEIKKKQDCFYLFTSNVENDFVGHRNSISIQFVLESSTFNKQNNAETMLAKCFTGSRLSKSIRPG